VDEDGSRLRPVETLPDGRLSKARKGCGEVTVGREGIEGFDLELLAYWSGFKEGAGRGGVTGTDAAARFCSWNDFSRWRGTRRKYDAPRLQNTSLHNDSSVLVALLRRIHCKPFLNL
jgi:hypothetical protein